jgi:molybdenum cofactor cytidylyltransferase
MIEKSAIDCVMLAAGESTRLRPWKMTLPWKNSTIVECSVGVALEVCTRVILVTGYRSAELERLFRGREQVTIAFNSRYGDGMFSSIQRGANLVESERFFLALGDMPLVDCDTYRVLLQNTEAHVMIPQYRGKKGHPILLSREVAHVIADLKPINTMRDVLEKVQTMTVPVKDRHTLSDIDDLEDYKRLFPVDRS